MINFQLMQYQFDRLEKNPSDAKLLTLISVEFGITIVRGELEKIRPYRVMAAKVLKVFAENDDSSYACGVLSALLDIAEVAEEELTRKLEENT